MFHRSIRKLHNTFVLERRKAVLAQMISGLIEEGSTVLDIGCGDGDIGGRVSRLKDGVRVSGLEVKSRPWCAICYGLFNGVVIPLPADSVDVCMLVDVLHHTERAKELLYYAKQTSRRYVIIKDHICENRSDYRLLKLMDWCGNRAHGVDTPCLYKSRQEWRAMIEDVGLRAVSWSEDVPIYPRPLDSIFGNNLHFVALLEKTPE